MRSRLQYISQGLTFAEQEANITKALQAGADWIQVRWKHHSGEELRSLCFIAKQLCLQFGAVCIINDHIHLAKETDADGVHLGLQDTSIAAARALLGQDKIIGGTANSIEDINQRIAEECDYIGVGPYRFTATKEKLSPILGLKGYQNILTHFKKKNIVLPPIYAIGGIELEDISAIRSIGIHGIALSKLITEQPDLIPEIKTILQ